MTRAHTLDPRSFRRRPWIGLLLVALCGASLAQAPGDRSPDPAALPGGTADGFADEAAAPTGSASAAADPILIGRDACFASLDILRQRHERCVAVRDTRLGDEAGAVAACRRELIQCTGQTPVGALPPWATEALAALFADALGIEPAGACGGVSVVLVGREASVTLRQQADAGPLPADTSERLTALVPDLALSVQIAAAPCVGGAAPVAELVRTVPLGLADYAAREDSSGLELLSARELAPSDLARLPPVADCARLGAEFTQRYPVPRSSLPSFFVNQDGRVALCKETAGTWQPRRLSPDDSIQAHLLLSP